MSYDIIREKRVLAFPVENGEKAYVTAYKFADSSLRDENGKMVESWGATGIAVSKEAMLDRLALFAADVNSGSIRLKGLSYGGRSAGFNYFELGAKAFRRMEGWLKKDVIEPEGVTLPPFEKWESDPKSVTALVNEALREATRSYGSDYLSPPQFDEDGPFPILDTNGGYSAAMRHFCKSIAGTDALYYLSEDFAEEVKWQREKGRVEVLDDALHYYYSSFGLVLKENEERAKKFSSEAVLFGVETILKRAGYGTFEELIDVFFYAPEPFAALTPAQRTRLDDMLILAGQSMKGLPEKGEMIRSLPRYIDKYIAKAMEIKQARLKGRAQEFRSASPKALAHIVIGTSGSIARASNVKETEKALKNMMELSEVFGEKIFVGDDATSEEFSDFLKEYPQKIRQIARSLESGGTKSKRQATELLSFANTVERLRDDFVVFANDAEPFEPEKADPDATSVSAALKTERSAGVEPGATLFSPTDKTAMRPDGNAPDNPEPHEEEEAQVAASQGL